ncbi:MAG: lysophospholipid acyltransferase family protein [Bacteroidetes bacterium]|nr:lysophospholipid acyltransferase family protein [Bacteroidota bacterium]
MKSTLEYLLFLGISRVLQFLPLGLVRMLARAFAGMVYFLIPIRKKLTLSQLRRAFPDRSDAEINRLARGSYVNLVTTIFELMWTPRLDDVMLSRILRLQNPDVLEDARKRGLGLVLMSGHFGNWEWLNIGVPRLLGLSVVTVVHPLHNPAVDALVESWRTMFGNRVVPLGISIRDIIRTLRTRGIVGMIADQSGPSGAYYVRFFGRHAATYEGPATFALRTGAPIVIGFAIRAADGNYDVVFEEISSRNLGETEEQRLRELTRRHVRALERMVAEHPAQWLWQHKRWKHAPHADSVLIEDPEDA